MVRPARNTSKLLKGATSPQLTRLMRSTSRCVCCVLCPRCNQTHFSFKKRHMCAAGDGSFSGGGREWRAALRARCDERGRSHLCSRTPCSKVADAARVHSSKHGISGGRPASKLIEGLHNSCGFTRTADACNSYRRPTTTTAHLMSCRCTVGVTRQPLRMQQHLRTWLAATRQVTERANCFAHNQGATQRLLTCQSVHLKNLAIDARCGLRHRQCRCRVWAKRNFLYVGWREKTRSCSLCSTVCQMVARFCRECLKRGSSGSLSGSRLKTSYNASVAGSASVAKRSY